MKKIGIITPIYNNFNYGGVLQAYSINYYLNKNFATTETIQYSKPKVNPLRKVLRYFNLIKFLKSIKRLAKKMNFKQYKAIKQSVNREDLFQSAHNKIAKSKNVYTKSTIVNLKEEYDYLIVGSDIVWNYDTGILDISLMKGLELGTTKIAAYSASVGVNKPDKKTSKILRRELAKFEMIGVREDSLQSYISCFINKPIYHVLDPIFLLSDEEWDSFIGDKRKNIKRKYILIYLLGGHKDKESIILRFARSENLDIIDISEKQSFLSKDIYFDNRCTPEDFVYYIKNASLVITDSFHGIAFCIKFCVKAMVVDRIQSTSYSISDRVLSMLRAANLMSIFKKPDFTLDDLNSIYLNEQISNKENIERMLNTSKKFLKEFLTNV